ncbi:MAG: peptidylprolyl isomerase [bacterium]|nr:peptidylprolyl isomerase [bacterium]
MGYLNKSLIIVLCFFFIPAIVGTETIDRIVGIVGNKVVTQSELDEAMLLTQLTPSDSLRLKILEQLIERNLLLIQAENETLEVSDEELSATVSSAMLELRGRFLSDEVYKDELKRTGLTEESLIDRYKKEARENLLIQKLFQKKFGKELAVSDIEAINFYNTYKDSIPPEPASIRFLGIIVPYRLSSKAQSIAEKKVNKILDRIKRGESFEKLAKKYSDDKVTRSHGGDLGSLNIRELAKEFQDVVSKLDVGETNVVQTADAYHIIKCDEKYGDILHLRDIVIRIYPTHSDSQSTKQTLELVKEKLKLGEPIEGLDVKITAKGEEFIPLYSTPFSVPLESINIGEIYTFSNPYGFEVIKPIELQPERKLNFYEMRQELKQFIHQRKLVKFYSKLISELKQEIFVKVML